MGFRGESLSWVNLSLWTLYNPHLTHLLHDVGGEDAGGEGAAEDVGELLVQAADAHLLKVPVGVDDGLPGLLGLGLTCQPEHALVVNT